MYTVNVDFIKYHMTVTVDNINGRYLTIPRSEKTFHHVRIPGA